MYMYNNNNNNFLGKFWLVVKNVAIVCSLTVSQREGVIIVSLKNALHTVQKEIKISPI